MSVVTPLRDEQSILADTQHIIQKQFQYIKDLLASPQDLYQRFYLLESKFNNPYILYIPRTIERIPDTEKTEIIEQMEQQLTDYIQNQVHEDYTIRFTNIRNVSFSVYYQTTEIVRFSLMNRNYSHMNTVITEEEFLRNVEQIKDSIQQTRERLEQNQQSINEYQYWLQNYWKLLKQVKTPKDLYLLIFKQKIMRKKLQECIQVKQQKIDIDNKQIQTEKEYLIQLEEQKEESKKWIQEMDSFFQQLNYKLENKFHFYF